MINLPYFVIQSGDRDPARAIVFIRQPGPGHCYKAVLRKTQSPEDRVIIDLDRQLRDVTAPASDKLTD